MALADAGYDGADARIRLPIKPPHTVPRECFSFDNQAYNLLQRGIGERTMAVLTGRWRVLRRRWALPTPHTPSPSWPSLGTGLTVSCGIRVLRTGVSIRTAPEGAPARTARRCDRQLHAGVPSGPHGVGGREALAPRSTRMPLRPELSAIMGH
ncbi:hypothetical protein Acsp03_46860 [Actinomadura sp. NBRC 104412]|nr:hypothetical protein Acsp03_46860 [Actinomadura sp. NBRC 104412]